MKKLLLMMAAILLVSITSACTPQHSKAPAASTTAVTASDIASETTATETKENTMNQITVTVGDKAFTATLQENEAARTFVKRLPLTVPMQELHGNEKYYYFDSALPADAAVPERIHSGDIKLFGDDCLVLFYDDFSTSYSYTDIGALDDTDGLKEALGSGDVTVTFALTTP